MAAVDPVSASMEGSAGVVESDVQRAGRASGRVGAWRGLHQSALLWTLVTIAVLFRVLLAVRSPTPYGYVFDFYHEAIQKSYNLGRLALAADCWQCYHPPFFTLLGLPFYALGKHLLDGPSGLADPALTFLTAIPLLAGAVTAWFGYGILRLYRVTGSDLTLGTGLILAFPCLFISSLAVEADILLTALMTAFLYYLVLFLRRPADTALVAAARLGLVAGLACATKYTGLIAPLVLVIAAALAALRHHRRGVLLQRTALALTICVVVGSWAYVDNLRRYGTPLHANGSAQQGFVLTGRTLRWDAYDFSSLRIRDLVRLAHGRVRDAPLTDVPFYSSVWTTLHGMAWGDMGMFSDPSRHGFSRHPYPRKAINPALASAVLILGLIPSGLALVGFLMTLNRRALGPLAVSCIVTMATYVSWLLSQPSWGIKTKYILFLLPAYALYTVLGLRVIRRLSPTAGSLCAAALVVLIVIAHVYLLEFAWR